MKEKLRMVYNCEYCNKRYLIKSVAELHEQWCGCNPNNFPRCNGCGNLEEYKKEITIHLSGDYQYEREVKAFRCTAKNIGLYPSKVLQKDMVKKYPENFIGEELMPKECELYSDHFNSNNSFSLPF